MKSSKKDIKLVVGPVLHYSGCDRITVVWETREEVIGEVVYGAPGTKRERIPDSCPVSLHRSALTGLTTATIYDYSVIANGTTLFRGSFKTPPARGPYRVVIFGDPHVPADGFRTLAPRITAENPDLIVCLGDIVAGPHHQQRWPSFFEMGKDLFARIPFATAVGNHDVQGGTVLYDRYIGRPEGTPEGYYYDAFDVGPDYFLILDSRNDHLFFHHGFWLIGKLREMKRRRDVRNVFVFSHLGPVSYKGIRRGFIGLKPLLPLMVRAGVSAMFSGHDHHYVRGKIHRGFPFFVSGGGGGKSHPVSQYSAYGWFAGKKEVQAEANHYLVMDVGDARCTVRAIDDRGAVFDEAVLSPRAGRAVPED
jgi:hypothetical protein